MVTLSQPAIQPQQGESEEAFIQRAHYSLMASVPDPDQRNEMVWRAWDQFNGNKLRAKARNYFPPERYRHVESIPIFYEHETLGRDKTVHRYDVNELTRMCKALNDRSDTNCYSAIASHHTSDQLKGPDVEPETIGYAGVYRLGMIGTDNPKWGIFADEFHRNDRLEVFNARRRRSVEVLRFKDGRPPILDPIATLGVDSPRLNLPVARYEAVSDDGVIERYSFMSMASVGGSSSFVPKTQYGGNDYSMPGGGDEMPSQRKPFDSDPQGSAMGPMAPGAIKQVLDGLRSLPEFAMMREIAGMLPHMKDLIQQRTLGISDKLGPDPQAGAMPPAMDPPMPMNPPMPNGGDNLQLPPQAGMQKPPMVPPAPTSQPGPVAPLPPPEKKEPYSIEGNEVTPERYAALEQENVAMREKFSEVMAQNQELAEKYSTISEANKMMMGEYKQLRTAVANLEKIKMDSDRKDAINELVEKYGITDERNEMYEKCLYSHGSEMTHESFVTFIETTDKALERYAAKSPVHQPMIPEGVLPEQQGEHERYAAIMDASLLPAYEGLGYDEIESRLVADKKLSPRK